jgi:hypothetical protein
MGAAGMLANDMAVLHRRHPQRERERANQVSQNERMHTPRLLQAIKELLLTCEVRSWRESLGF